jgi:glutathione S-transferase
VSAGRPVLHIGDKTYSSWSMRPWLALRWAGIAFDEHQLRLGPRDGGLNPAIAAISPSGRVPALHLPGGETIWDSLAICEWAAEEAPDAGLWPADPLARALARSAAAEMHAGFSALRQTYPMNLRRTGAPIRGDASRAAADVARIDALWRELRGRFGAGGPFLFGARPGIADAMFAPVATRFRSYGVALSAPAQAYGDALLADPAFKEWDEAAKAEDWTIAETDAV